MNAKKLANDWDIDEQAMMDYLLAITGDDLDDLCFMGSMSETIDEDNLDEVELDGEQVSEILKLYFEDQNID